MNFDLHERTILLTIAGSRAYGIHTEDSDVDVKGVAVPPREYYFGCQLAFDQADKASHMRVFEPLLNAVERSAVQRSKIEGTVYALRKFCKLAMDANPNILDVLFCRDDEVRMSTAAGERLRADRDLFISAKCKHTFSGYAFQQLNRIKLHRRWLMNPPDGEPKREDFGIFGGMKPNQVKAALAAVNKVLDGWELDLSRLDKAERVQVMEGVGEYLSELSIGADEKWMAAGRTIGYSENFLVLLDRERQWKVAREDWKKYLDWRASRNPDRAVLEEKFGYDTKHAAHLFRLLKMAGEIMTTGQVNVWREDRDEILAVRGGQWSYERLVEWAEQKDRELTEIYRSRSYSIPHDPDRNAIDRLCIELTEDALRV